MFSSAMLMSMVLFLSFFVGFRSDHVGTDTIAYKEIYLSITPLDDFFAEKTFGFLAQRVEVGFVLFASFFRMLGLSFNMFLSFLTFFSIVIFITACTLMQSRSKFLILIIYLSSFSFITMHFNILRQGVSASFILLAAVFLAHGKVIKYLLSLFLAFSFHSVGALSLLMLPVYWLSINIKTDHEKNNKIDFLFFIWLLFLVIFILPFNYLSEILSYLRPYHVIFERSWIYFNNEVKPFNIYSISILFDLILIFYLYYKLRYDKNAYKEKFLIIFFYIYIYQFLLVFAFKEFSLMASRLHFLLGVFNPIFICYVINSSGIKNNLCRTILIAIICFAVFIKNISITAQFITDY